LTNLYLYVLLTLTFLRVLWQRLHQTPEMIVNAAIQEDVDIIGLSIMSGAHNYLMPRVIDLLKEKNAEDIKVFGGGIIPDEDILFLKEKGVLEIFTPGASLDYITQRVGEMV
jgi:methylmalonyl-CoA mutase C-terminal domain/subunit